MNDVILTEVQAAELLGNISPKTLQSWRVSGRGPVFIKVGRLVRYRLADLEMFLQQNRRRSTSDVGPIEEQKKPTKAVH
jgi:predicted site-specific integrase-resolvase